MVNYRNKPAAVTSDGISGYSLKRMLRGQVADGRITINANDAAIAEYARES